MDMDSSISIEKAFKIIEDHIDEADFRGPIELEMILQAEKILGVTFPKSYIQFLEKYGDGSLFGIEIYGITRNRLNINTIDIDTKGVLNCITYTQELRENELTLLPRKLVIISETGYGPYYVLDTSQMDKNQECPVYMWDVGDLREKVADSFGDFLFDGLQGILDIELSNKTE